MMKFRDFLRLYQAENNLDDKEMTALIEKKTVKTYLNYINGITSPSYKDKKYILDKLNCTKNIKDNDGFMYGKKYAERLDRIKREKSYLYSDYKFHYYPENYFKALMFMCNLLKEHGYTYFHKALEISSKYYKVDKKKLKNYFHERQQDGIRYNEA